MNADDGTKNTIEPSHLAEMITNGIDLASTGKLVIIDCRRFLEYNVSHIRNAINICCSKLIRKRLQENKMSVMELVRTNWTDLASHPHPVGNGALAVSGNADQPINVILYADGYCGTTTGAAGRKCQDNGSFLAILMDKFKACSQFRSISMLKGGFVDFQTRYPELCEGASSGLGGMGSATGGSRSSTLGVASKLTLSSLSHPCLPVSNQGPTKILAFLYLGSQQDAMDQETLTKHGIDYVLNLSVSCPKPDFVQDEHFMRIAVNDSHSEKLLPYFERAFEFLDKVKEANSCVLVHCLAGISRSPTLAIAFVMRHLHMSSEEAYRYVKEKRPAISPNFNFLGQLLEYEKQLQTSRQPEHRHCFNSLTPTVMKVENAVSTCVSVKCSKTAASTPDYAAVTKPLLFLNLQNRNTPSDGSLAQCAPGSDATAPADPPKMKRSASCPVKIQKNGAGNMALRDALNLAFEFSTASRTNVNGKRQMIVSSDEATPPRSPCGAKTEEPAQNELASSGPDEPPASRPCVGKFDKIPSEKFWNSDYYSKRGASPKSMFQILRPLHEELPSPSTELSKLNFGSSSGGCSETMEMEIVEESAEATTLPSIDRSSHLPPQVQFEKDDSTARCSNSPTTFPTMAKFGKLEHRSSFTMAYSYSTSAANPFFGSSGSWDFKSRNRLKNENGCGFESCVESMTTVEKSAGSPHSTDSGVSSSRVSEYRPSFTSQDSSTTTTSWSSPVPTCGLSVENPLFTNPAGLTRNCKQWRPCRRVSLPDTAEDHEGEYQQGQSAVPLTDGKEDGRELANGSILSGSHLSSSSDHLASMREKLAAARDSILSTFSRRMRHLLTKRASWPTVIPYAAGFTSSSSETSALWALAPVKSTSEREGVTVNEPEVSTKSAGSSNFVYGRMECESGAVCSTDGSGTQNFTLTPGFDMDSPESGFVESPSAMSYQRESAASSAVSSHIAQSASSAIFFRRDPERDSLGSTSSLEIAVS